jgi:hypothetical protein
MAGPVLYSANPWFSTQVAEKYRGGNYFAWVCEFFDSERDAPSGSAGVLIAPSSNPRKIYEDLLNECNAEEEHTRLAKQWRATGEITPDQYDEIIASVRAKSWKIWRPVLYVIPRTGLDAARIKEVHRRVRAAYGPEYQILDLKRHEFDIIDLSGLVRSR